MTSTAVRAMSRPISRKSSEPCALARGQRMTDSDPAATPGWQLWRTQAVAGYASPARARRLPYATDPGTGPAERPHQTGHAIGRSTAKLLAHPPAHHQVPATHGTDRGSRRDRRRSGSRSNAGALRRARSLTEGSPTSRSSTARLQTRRPHMRRPRSQFCPMDADIGRSLCSVQSHSSAADRCAPG